MADVHLTNGAAQGNTREARRLYAKIFPQRQPPHHIITSTDRRLRETEGFRCSMSETRRPCFSSTLQREQTILEAVAINPKATVRGLAIDVVVSHSTVWTIFHVQLFHSYHFH